MRRRRVHGHRPGDCRPASTLTYANFGSTFVTEHCLECHERDESPTLATQSQVASHRAEILREAVYTNAMPEDDVVAGLALGAELCYLGTRFIASTEGGAIDAHKAKVVTASAEDSVTARVPSEQPCRQRRGLGNQMNAKQTVVSASLLLLVVPVAPALADPGEPPERPDEAALVDPLPDEPPPVPGKSGRFLIGAGFTSDEGFVATARIEHLDLFRTGTQLALDARLSARAQRFAVGFTDPTLFGSSIGFAANLYTDHRSMHGFQRQATGGSLTLSHDLGPHVRGFLGYRVEQIEVTPDAGAIARGLAPSDPFRGGRLAALRAGIEYNTLDQQYMPRRGSLIGTSIEVADRDIGSEIQMIRTDAWMSHHRALGPFTLHVGGTLSTVSNGTPFSERLHFEGSRDIRGYAFGALGPRDDNGMSLGGTLKYTARGEIEVPLISRIGLSAAGWADTGGILAESGRWSGASAGFGLIWRSPIGPLRIDYAFPLDGSPPGFVFGLGGTW